MELNDINDVCRTKLDDGINAKLTKKFKDDRPAVGRSARATDHDTTESRVSPSSDHEEQDQSPS